MSDSSTSTTASTIAPATTSTSTSTATVASTEATTATTAPASTGSTATVPAPAPAAKFDEEELVSKTHNMFEQLAKYIKGELTSTCGGHKTRSSFFWPHHRITTVSAADYKLLEEMNIMSAQKYAGMTANAEQLAASMHQLSVQYAQLQPQLEQIERLGASIEQLENTVRALDRYTLHLADKARNIDPQILQQAHLQQQQQQRGGATAAVAVAAAHPSPAQTNAPAATSTTTVAAPATVAPTVSDQN
jgi:hypothetical protein